MHVALLTQCLRYFSDCLSPPSPRLQCVGADARDVDTHPETDVGNGGEESVLQGESTRAILLRVQSAIAYSMSLNITLTKVTFLSFMRPVTNTNVYTIMTTK